jgi:hypothetical protein
MLIVDDHRPLSDLLPGGLSSAPGNVWVGTTRSGTQELPLAHDQPEMW